MLCEECMKNESEVLITTVVNSTTLTRRLCRDCARKYRSGSIRGVFSAITLSFPFPEDAQQKMCPECGTAFSAFVKTGLLGCSECYTAFHDEIASVLSKVTGKSEHTGSAPAYTKEQLSQKDELLGLNRKMKKAIDSEDYETAAVLRDRISALTGVLSGKDTENE